MYTWLIALSLPDALEHPAVLMHQHLCTALILPGKHMHTCIAADLVLFGRLQRQLSLIPYTVLVWIYLPHPGYAMRRDTAELKQASAFSQ